MFVHKYASQKVRDQVLIFLPFLEVYGYPAGGFHFQGTEKNPRISPVHSSDTAMCKGMETFLQSGQEALIYTVIVIGDAASPAAGSRPGASVKVSGLKNDMYRLSSCLRHLS